MLSYCRPEGSKTHEQFVKRYVDTLPGVHKDKAGNRMVKVGKGYATAFSCHTDSVHRFPGRQKVGVDPTGDLCLANGSMSSCLGADDASGVYILRKLIEAKIPGLYLFHTGEEVGGVGSNYIACKTPDLLKNIKFAVAFDRKGYRSIITHQIGGVCASEEFAWSLAYMLGLNMVPDPTGTFTDTANYTYIVPECTNLSVGYDFAHSNKEIQDPWFLAKLVEALVDNWDESKLDCCRKPEPEDFGYRGSWQRDVDDMYPPLMEGLGYRRDGDLCAMVRRNPGATILMMDEYGIIEPGLDLMAYDNPEELADMLTEYGLNCADLQYYVDELPKYMQHVTKQAMNKL